MAKFDLLIKNGKLIDAANDRIGLFDVALSGGRVADVAADLNPDHAGEIYDAAGKLVFPGLVDSHVHLAPAERSIGFRMLARTGVTCCLECGGYIEDVLEGMERFGSGISVAVLNRLDPGDSISGPDAGKPELSEYLDRSLESGAFGFKLLGGHLPLSPETTACAIELVNREMGYVAFHCGTTRNGSNLNGLLDALELAGDNRLHICHITAYCRGLTHGSAVEETMIALAELAARPHLVSESHNGPYNGTWAELENGVPRSHVTRTCLKSGGFDETREGMLAAARAGYMRVQNSTDGGVVYLEPGAGAAHLEKVDFDTMVSFPVNLRSTAFLTATEKDPSGRFIVTALSTDGGAIPRNFLLSHGLSLVRFDAWSLPDFVLKCCWAPARMLGLPRKGHLAPGADGDLVVVDPDSHEALLTIAGGKVIMANGVVLGSEGTVVTTERGVKTLKQKGIQTQAADLANSLFYNAPGEFSPTPLPPAQIPGEMPAG
jgi:hypothetical protein